MVRCTKNRQYLVKFYRGECLGSPHTGYGSGWIFVVLPLSEDDPSTRKILARVVSRI